MDSGYVDDDNLELLVDLVITEIRLLEKSIEKTPKTIQGKPNWLHDGLIERKQKIEAILADLRGRGDEDEQE
jgi:hypothetical protein